LKICLLAACPFPANHGTPGAIREMAEALSEHGHEVHIVTYHFGEDIPVRGPQLHRIPALTSESAVIVGPTTRRPLYDLQMIFKTLQVIYRHRPDVLHAHGYEAALVAWVCRSLTRIPVVYSGHNTMADELPTYRFIRPRWLAKVLARLLDAIVPRLVQRCIPHSANIDRFFREMGLGSRTEPIINFGIDVETMRGGNGASVRQRYSLGAGPVVLYAGVLDEFQRLDLLLEAMKTVLEYEPQSKLLLVVTIPQERHLAAVRRQAAQLGIAEHLILTDPQPLGAVRDCLAACDVAVVPRPRAPGFPIKSLNYLAAGKPCVLFASSASTGLRDGHNARLVTPDTSAALATGILEVLRDRRLRKRLAHNGHQFVREHHDRSAITHQIWSAYARTLVETGRGAILTQRPTVGPTPSSQREQEDVVRAGRSPARARPEETLVEAGELSGGSGS
jgi:glycosyltransferase involved in cell wall biosynthesis